MNEIKAAFAAIFLAGCAVNERLAPVPVACPPNPKLPVVMEAELQGLSDDAYRRLVERELRLREHIGQLRTLCEEGL